MPRGRPPIPRSTEEALRARREQVRNNVQAFRKRKQAGIKTLECHTAKDVDDYTSVQDGGQEYSDHNQSQEAPPEDGAPQQHAVQLNRSSSLSGLLQNQPMQLFSTSNEPSISSQIQPIVLPPLIDSGPTSLQQFTSNVATRFCPDSITTGAHWFQIVPSFVNRDQTLDLSIQALCLLQVSLVDRESHVFQKSLSLYNGALQRLRSSLLQPAKGFKMEIFAATLALSSFELLQGTKSQGREWMQHIEGGTTYLNIFPSLDVSTITDQISFHFLETICIFDALGSRRPSCFSSSKWWRNSVDRYGGDAYGPLLRMLTSLPAVLEQCDYAYTLAQQKVKREEWERLLQLCLRLEDAFLAWFERTLGLDVFADIYVARLYLLYWPSMILLYDSMSAILHKTSDDLRMPGQPIMPVAQSEDPVASPQVYTRSSTAFAGSILASVPFCLDPKYGVVGRSLILLPLYVARNHFRQVGDAARADECDGWLEKLGQKNMSFGLKVKKGL